MLQAVFPGSFDPPTNGHLNLIRRAAGIFDRLHVVIAVNPNKGYFFSADERFGLMESMVDGFANVEVHTWDKLIVDFAERVEARVLLRGVRALADFAYEFELSMVNKGLNGRIETMFLPTDQKYFVLRSSFIKELAALGGDISAMVPPAVAEALARKLQTTGSS
jgi:pantetheine-phosphate adenylyltransferase